MYNLVDNTNRVRYSSSKINKLKDGWSFTTGDRPTEFFIPYVSGGTIDPETKELTGYTYIEGATQPEIDAEVLILKSRARNSIDTHAEYTMNRITGGDAQNIYVWVAQFIKALQANDIDNDEKANDDRHPRAWRKENSNKKHKIVENEAAAFGMTTSQMKDIIIGKADQQQDVFGAIEPIRVGTKLAIDACITGATIQSALDSGIASLDAIT
ncbi:hypothetical protein [uncultured Paraglaciecola sp.]|uniref:hypothetical protein n=1 Tax=uncultured Paraglaciecola sp. TaxID=1765024 RepID=UPI00262F3CFC|nr:hypothetical protein [uncultured Paraglaciecola sp.]